MLAQSTERGSDCKHLPFLLDDPVYNGEPIKMPLPLASMKCICGNCGEPIEGDVYSGINEYCKTI